MSPVHQDYASFKAYWDEMLEKLQPTPVTDFAMQVTRTACPFPYVPKFIWWLVDPILNKTSLWIARGTLPEKPRKALGLTWSRREEKVLRVFSGLVKFSFKLLPREWGYFPRARKGLVRVRKQKLEQQPI